MSLSSGRWVPRPSFSSDGSTAVKWSLDPVRQRTGVEDRFFVSGLSLRLASVTWKTSC